MVMLDPMTVRKPGEDAGGDPDGRRRHVTPDAGPLVIG